MKMLEVEGPESRTGAEYPEGGPDDWLLVSVHTVASESGIPAREVRRLARTRGRYVEGRDMVLIRRGEGCFT